MWKSPMEMLPNGWHKHPHGPPREPYWPAATDFTGLYMPHSSKVDVCLNYTGIKTIPAPLPEVSHISMASPIIPPPNGIIHYLQVPTLPRQFGIVL